MATNRDLLREAIADAKAVKETAIANAKAALTESFTPFLREKLSAKIQEMDEEEDDDFTSMTNSNKKRMLNKEEKKRSEMTQDEKDEYDAESRRLTSMEEIEIPRGGRTQSQQDDYNEESRRLTSMEEAEDEDLDEISLDELLAELEENDSKMEDENLYEAKKDEEKDEEISIEDMSEDDLKSFIEDVIKDMVANKELEAGHEGMENEEGAEEEGEEEEEEETESEEEEVDLEELLAEIEGGEELEEGIWAKIKGTASGIAKAANMFKQPADFVKEMEAALKEDPKLKENEEFMASYKFIKGLAVASKAGSDTNVNKPMEEVKDAEIEELKYELNEINLLNSKLLYTNKIFRSKSLSESQKIKVLTAFDKAKNKKEAQLVYETLLESLKVSNIGAKTAIKESLGSASKSLGSANAKPIIENNAFARMRELAGLKK